MTSFLLITFYLFFPALILFICHKFPFVNKIGAVVLAYFAGIILGNSGLLPDDYSIQNLLTTLSVPIAIPLLLFSSDIKSWFKLAKSAFISMLLALFSVILIVCIGFFVFNTESSKDLWKISGMLIGVYSGGTPNLASLKLMLNVDENTYILTHTYDMILSSVYLLFLITIGQTFFNLFLKPFKHEAKEETEIKDGKDPYTGILKRKNLINLLKGFVLAVFVFGIGGGLSLLFPDSLQMTVVILTITSLGIAFSFIHKVRSIPYTFESGMYLILIFSLVVASMADISKFKEIGSNLFLYISFAVFGSLFLHALLAKLFKIDSDTLMVTSASLICSPPFVPLIAGAIKNPKVIISGLTVGILGYAIGNYLGFAVAKILEMF